MITTADSVYKTGWYVLYVKSFQEKKVHQRLQEKELESFLPMVRTIRQWSDRKKTILKPMFPSYVFVKISTFQDFHKALSTDGVRTYIRFGNEYVSVREEEIAQIKLFVDSEDVSDIKVSSSSFEIGEIRKINFGSLSGLECEILKINNTNKIIVRIDSLQQNITATLPAYYLSEILSA